jgi:hypothetical protein
MGLGKSSKLLDADPRDRPTDHETLDLRGPFEDRVGPIGATVSTGHGNLSKGDGPTNECNRLSWDQVESDSRPH